MNTNMTLTDAQDVFLGKLNQICNKFGLNNIMAQLYAILYLSDDPLSLSDMVDRLNISKASASVNIRAVERYGAVRRVWVKGSRRDYYEANKDISMVIMDRIGAMAHSRISEIDDMLKSSYQVIDSLNPKNKEEQRQIEISRERLDRLNALYDRMQVLFGLFNSRIVNNALTLKANANRNSRKGKRWS